MAYGVAYLILKNDIPTCLVVSINQIGKMHFAFRLWRVIYLLISMEHDVHIVISSMYDAISIA